MKTVFNLTETRTHFKNIQKSGFFLNVNGKCFDANDWDLVTKLNKRLINKYWDWIIKLIGQESKIVLRFNIQALNSTFIKNVFKLENENFDNFYFKTFRFRQTDGSSEEDSDLMMECGNKLFRKLFNEYWFALGSEEEMEILVFNKSFIVDLDDIVKKRKFEHRDLKFKVNNLRTGFHFSIMNYGEDLNLSGGPYKLE